MHTAPQIALLLVCVCVCAAPCVHTKHNVNQSNSMQYKWDSHLLSKDCDIVLGNVEFRQLIHSNASVMLRLSACRGKHSEFMALKRSTVQTPVQFFSQISVTQAPPEQARNQTTEELNKTIQSGGKNEQIKALRSTKSSVLYANIFSKLAYTHSIAKNCICNGIFEVRVTYCASALLQVLLTTSVYTL